MWNTKYTKKIINTVHGLIKQRYQEFPSIPLIDKDVFTQNLIDNIFYFIVSNC